MATSDAFSQTGKYQVTMVALVVILLAVCAVIFALMNSPADKVALKMPLVQPKTEATFVGNDGFAYRPAAPAAARPKTLATATGGPLLTAVFFSTTNAGQSFAVIRDQFGAEAQYHVLQDVPGGYTINRIFPDHVLVVHAGKFEELWLGGSNSKANLLAGRNSGLLAKSTELGVKTGGGEDSAANLQIKQQEGAQLLLNAYGLHPNVGILRPAAPRNGNTSGTRPQPPGATQPPPAWSQDSAAFDAWFNSPDPEPVKTPEDQAFEQWWKSDQTMPP